MADRGPHPAPNDGELEAHFIRMIGKDGESLGQHLTELRDTVVETFGNGEPEVFSYARMVNFLGRDDLVNRTDLIHLCAAAMWRIDRMNNGPKATLHVLETDRNDGGTPFRGNQSDCS